MNPNTVPKAEEAKPANPATPAKAKANTKLF